MTDWADEFFVKWQRAWGTGTEAVLEYVTDDIEYRIGKAPIVMGSRAKVFDLAYYVVAEVTHQAAVQRRQLVDHRRIDRCGQCLNGS